MKRFAETVAPAVIILALSAFSAGAADYSWQKPQAKVLPTGDLEWAPELFKFEVGASVRYIDYEAGKDENAGTKAAPWKHHPWDKNAGSKAAAAKGVDTFVFKRGVIYRGAIVVKESGKPGSPIRLTSDPGWGKGEAMFYGSERITGGWKRGDAASAPGIPEPEKVWFQDIGTDWTPHALWELRGDDIIRIPIARMPNWKISNPDDPQKEWYAWTGRERGKGSIDMVNLTQTDPNFFDGGHLWTEWSGNMGTIHIGAIKSYNPQKRMLQGGNGSPGNRYFVENVRGLLDTQGEYFHSVTKPHAGRLYLRMPEDRDPNAAVLEASKRVRLIDIVDKHDVVVSGLTFRFNDIGSPFSGWPTMTKHPTVIRAAGHCQNVRISHCVFQHVASVFNAHPRMNKKYSDIYLRDMKPWRQDEMDNIAFTDNNVAYTDRSAVTLAEGRMLTRVELPPYGKLKRIEVLRNRFYHCASRPGSNMYSAIPTLSAFFPETAEIAGNIIDRSWGSGLFVFGGKVSGEIGEVPLTRILIHHNRITNAMLACNDYGGLEYWQGGPIYAFNNISGNSIGYRHYAKLSNDWKTVAYNVYLDGTFKSYTFNNIIWGKSNDPTYPYRNRGGYFVVLGFMNHFFNNTIHNFRHGIVGSSGNRSSYLANVVDSISGSFIQQNRKGDTSLAGGGDTGEMGNRGVPTLAYGNNVFVGKGAAGNVGRIRGGTVDELRGKLQKQQMRLAQLGWHTPESPFPAADKLDFRPMAGSAVTDRGVRFFVPWALYGMVGEWNFIQHKANPQVVLGENFYMTDDWIERHMYDLVPRNDLRVPGATAESYVNGDLEDWAAGALHFDGKTTHCILSQEKLARDFTFPYVANLKAEKIGKGTTVYAGAKRRTVDMGVNNFLIEIHFRTEPGHTGGVLVSKMAGGTGYELAVSKSGELLFTVAVGTKQTKQGSPARINDGKWHHVIAEFDRATAMMRIYADGKKTAEASPVAMAKAASLSNTGDFLVGKSAAGKHFAGDVDFLRVARGTLADAKTTIEELYDWQFNGPQLRDFCGSTPKGKRDAGAIEAQ
jgi:concanavalin A-like lectin/glucanase superfamily protein